MYALLRFSAEKGVRRLQNFQCPSYRRGRNDKEGRERELMVMRGKIKEIHEYCYLEMC